MRHLKKILVLLIACLSGCINSLIGVDDLGNGYYFDYSYRQEANILFTEKASYDGIGFEVIPPMVEKVLHDKNYIIASSRSDTISYWIIDKTKPVSIQNIMSNVIGPLDSIKFATTLLEKGIDLKFGN